MLVFDMAEKTTWKMIGTRELAEMIRSHREEVRFESLVYLIKATNL